MTLLKVYEEMPLEWKRAPGEHLEDIFRTIDSFVAELSVVYWGDPEYCDITPGHAAAMDLRDVANARTALLQDLRELDEAVSPWEAFDYEPTPAEAEAWKQRQQARRAEVIASRKALRIVFVLACRIYRQVGARPTGGEVSRLKRLELTGGMKKALDELKRPPRTAFDDRGRLSPEDVSAIYSGLASAGLISGPLETFRKHFDAEPVLDPWEPLEPLQWTGGPSLLGYFIWRYLKRLPSGHTLRNYAAPVLNAFDTPEPQRRSVRRLLTLLNEGKQKTVRGGAVIDSLFDGLQGTGSVSAE